MNQFSNFNYMNPNMFNNMNQMNMNPNMFNNMNQMNMNQNMFNNINQFNINQNNIFPQNFNNNMNFQNMNVFNNNMNNMNMFNNMIMFNNMFNNMNNNMNMNNFVPNNNNNSNKDEAPKGVIERGDKIMSFNNEFPNTNRSSLRNINFHASSGLKVMLSVPDYITVKELFRLYIKKLGISESFLGKEIIFLFNALTLEVNDESLISDVFHRGIQTIVITVIDRNNVIGAKIF